MQNSQLKCRFGCMENGLAAVACQNGRKFHCFRCETELIEFLPLAKHRHAFAGCANEAARDSQNRFSCSKYSKALSYCHCCKRSALRLQHPRNLVDSNFHDLVRCAVNIFVCTTYFHSTPTQLIVDYIFKRNFNNKIDKCLHLTTQTQKKNRKGKRKIFSALTCSSTHCSFVMRPVSCDFACVT